jgi:hypothetical protein
MTMPEKPFASDFANLCVSDLVNGDTVDSDTVDSGPYYGFHVRTTGTVKFNTLAGTTIALPVTAGLYYAYGVSRLWATGHTTLAAADIELAR